ncbi:MAG TPA: GAF domain-containing protein [Aggregatilineaceae bacterium]|nr:GAF domain-containing protein [Aggregatilineaceae bacterium]
MPDSVDQIISDYSDNLNHLVGRISQLEIVLGRTVQALNRHGVQLSVDLDGMMQEIQQDLNAAEKNSRVVIDHSQQLQNLVRTFALITSSLELDQVLAEVMDTVIQLTGAERAYLMLRSPKSDELTIRAARNWDKETLSEQDVVFSRSIVATAVEQMEPIITTNALGDSRFQQSESIVEHGLRSILCIPLALHKRTVGVLYADNRIEQGIFKQTSIPLLTAFGTQAAIAIENARQYGQVKDDLREAQRELAHLQIQLDQHQIERQVSEITESEYFQKLTSAARGMRDAHRRKPS